jgi:hypothetical protein
MVFHENSPGEVKNKAIGCRESKSQNIEEGGIFYMLIFNEEIIADLTMVDSENK